MSIKILNEGFELLHKNSLCEEKSNSSDLEKALESALNHLAMRQEMNIKKYEIAFQDAIESQYPEKSWWEVTDCNIFSDLAENRDPSLTIKHILSGLKPELKEAVGEDSEKEYKVRKPIKESLRRKPMRESEMERFYVSAYDKDRNLTDIETNDVDEVLEFVFERFDESSYFEVEDRVAGKSFTVDVEKYKDPYKAYGKLKKLLGESLRRKRLRESEKEPEIKRYSDVKPRSERKYWYFTTHGVQPGSIPRDLNVLEIRDGQNDRGTWGTFVMLDGVLNTSELRKYDMRELAPKEETERRRIRPQGERITAWESYKKKNPVRESYDEKIVIYKDGQGYKATPESNYRARIQNARKIQNLKDFDSADEIIDYYVKYGWAKGRDDFEVIDECKLDERNLTRSKRHARKINEAGEVVYPARTGDDFEDAMNKKIARKNARDSWKEYEKSVEANREEKRKKASKIVSRKRTERNLQKAEDLVYELNRLGNKFIKVNVYLDNTGLYDILDTFTADSGYSNTSEITFYDDAAIDFYIPDNIVVNEDYGTIKVFEFGTNGFEFSVFNEKGAWSNTFKDLEYVIASNDKIYSYIKEEIIPISEKYLHDIKEYLKRTKLESISKKSKKSIRESFTKKHAKKLKENHRRKLTESFDDMEVFMNTWANYNENGADSGITPTGWMSIDDAIEYCEEYADYEPFINDTDNIPFDDINEYSNASSALQELKELQESGVDEDVLEAIIEATGYSVKEAIEIAERGDYYWYPGISSYTDLAYAVIDEIGSLKDALGDRVVNYIDEDQMRREYRWDIRETMRDTAEQEVDDAHEGEDEDSYDREQEIEDWMDEHEDEWLDMVIGEDIEAAERGEVDLSNYFDYEAFGRDLSFDGYTITDKGIILVN